MSKVLCNFYQVHGDSKSRDLYMTIDIRYFKDLWVNEVKMFFKYMECHQERMVDLVSYKLEGDVSAWSE